MKTFRLFALLTLLATPLFAEPAGLAPQPGETVAAILKRLVGQRVELRLESGQSIAGKVEAVSGDNLIHLSGLTGQELFEAVVVLDDVSAVVTRAPAK
jgi:hypothetical protein